MRLWDETQALGRFIPGEQDLALDDFQQRLVELLPRLRRLAQVLTRLGADADDLVQTTLERALERRSSWRAGTRLDAWMFTIMKNAWIDEVRRRGRQDARAAPPETADALPDPLSPTPALRLDAIALRAAIARLPDDQRLAVALVLVDGLSYAEAAEVMAVPQGTLTSRLGRARATLAAELQEAAP
jgi:RNA polymerase sigma-70 factor (ECF subfamily)